MKQYIDGDYLVTEYDSGAIIKILHDDDPKKVIKQAPPNPLLELKKANDELKLELDECKQSIAELTALASTMSMPQ